MAPKKQPWFRLYVETFGDLKIRRLKPEYRWLWVAVLAAARTSPVPGRLMLTEDDVLTSDDMADFAALPVKTVIGGLAEFERLGMMTLESGCWVVSKWGDRQYESDSSTERVTRHRSNGDVTANETAEQRSCNSPETENRIQRQITEVVSTSRSARPAAFERFYATYPRKKKPQDALRAWQKAEKLVGAEALQAAVEAHAAAWATWPDADRQFIPYPASWLNSGDYASEPDLREPTGRQAVNRVKLVNGAASIEAAPFAERALRGRTSPEGNPALTATASENRT